MEPKNILKRLFLTLVAVVAAWCAVANPVDAERARRVGANWLSLKGAAGVVKLEAVATPFAGVYVFNAAGGGFVLVAADDCVRPVLGYSPTGVFRAEAMPANVRAWLEGYDGEIARRAKAVQAGAKDAADGDAMAAAVAAEWSLLEEGVAPEQPLTTHVAPMLTTIWNQSPYYNAYCPYDTVYSQLTVAGCVATATAQIMKYWNHPATGYGTHAYVCNNGRISYGVLSADFGNTNYQWLSMPNALTSASSQAEVDAVATLIYHVGVASNMRYNVSAQGGSSTYNHNDYYPSAMSALVDHFKYAPDIVVVAPGSHNADAYSAMLRAELDLQRPILYDGRDASGGHSFVCDGYDEDNMFHFNWGWGGYCDGYYALGALNPAPGGTGGNATYTFNMNNTAMLGIRPNNMFGMGGSVTVNTVGSTTGCTVSGDGFYDFGDTVTLRAVAAEGYRFAGWSDNSAANPRIFTMTGGNYTFTARFETIGTDTMSYCGDMPFSSYWGEYQQGFDKYWGIKLPASSLTPGRTLTAVEFYVNNEYVGGQFDVTVLSGTTAPTDTVYSTSVWVGYEDRETWLPVFLHTLYTVEAGKSIWITFHNNDILFPATLTYSCGNPDGFLYGPSFAPDPEWTRFSYMIRGLFVNPGMVVDGDTISYCGDRPYNVTIGAAECGIMLPAAELSGRNYLTAVKVFPSNNGDVYTMRVYKGGAFAPRTLVHSQPVEAAVHGWNEVALDAMVPINTGDSLWITFSGPYGVNACRYTGHANSDWYRTGSVWQHNREQESEYSWMIKAVTSATAPVLPPPTVVVRGASLAGVGETVTFTAVHSEGTTVTWAIQGGTPATASGDTVAVSWNRCGFYRVSATVSNANGSTTDSLMVSVADCDSISLPYTADFTQCWTADGGAVITDSAHAYITSQGQTLTSPWLETVAGRTFLDWREQREGMPAYDGTERYSVTIEDSNGEIIERWDEQYVDGYGFCYGFESPGGLIRVVFEYTGSQTVPSFLLSNVALYQYDIVALVEGPTAVRTGDTVTYTAHATLQNGETPDFYGWNRYYHNGMWMAYDDSACTILAQTDSTLTLVWHTSGRYRISSYVEKYNVYQGHTAYVNGYISLMALGVNIYFEDSIIYTSSAKDTVIGCHPDLHTALLPQSVVTIADSAFFNCANLSTVSLPDGLEYIGKMAFALDYALTEVTIPQGVKFIGDNAFWNCSALTTVNFNADSCVAVSPTTASDGSYWPVFIGCNSVSTVNIGENVKRIPDRLFSYCNGLRGTLTIPDAVTYIGANAFYHWIDDWDWDNGSDWDTLQVVLGSGLTEIGDYAFGCPRGHITSVVSRAAVPPVIGEQTFYRYEPEYTPLLYVPCGSAQAYRSAQHWNRFQDIREDCSGVEEAVEDDLRVYATADGIVVEGACTGEPVAVYDVMGRRVLAAVAGGVISVPQTGVYMVAVGERQACKVVVLK